MSYLKWNCRMFHVGCRGQSLFRVLPLGLIALTAVSGLSAQSSSTPSLKAQAAQAQSEGQDEAATGLYAQALTQDPAWVEGWWRYGGLLYQGRQFQQAATAFGHLTQLAPQNSLGFAMLGVSEFELHDWNNAALHLSKALARGGLPEGIANGAMYDFGLVLLRQKNRNGALSVFRLLQHQAPDYPNLIPAFGSAELNLDQIPAPGSENAGAVTLVGKAAIAVLQLKTNDADSLYRQAIAEYPQLPFAHLCLALFLENLGQHAGAEEELKAEAKVNQASADPWIWLGRLALARRDADQTIPYAQEAVKRAPNDGLPYLILGKAYVLKKQWSESFEALRRAEILSPDSYEVHYALVTVYSAMNDTQSAAAERKLFTQSYGASHPPEKDGQ